mgnify:CR=1 FL=1
MRWVLGLVVIATPVWAEDAGPWTALDGAAIAALLTGQGAFDTVFRGGRRIEGRYLQLVAMPAARVPGRAGYVIGKKALPRAVDPSTLSVAQPRTTSYPTYDVKAAGVKPPTWQDAEGNRLSMDQVAANVRSSPDAVASVAALIARGSNTPIGYKGYGSLSNARPTVADAWNRGHGECDAIMSIGASLLVQSGAVPKNDVAVAQNFSNGGWHNVTVFRDPKDQKYKIMDYQKVVTMPDATSKEDAVRQYFNQNTGVSVMYQIDSPSSRPVGMYLAKSEDVALMDRTTQAPGIPMDMRPNYGTNRGLNDSGTSPLPKATDAPGMVASGNLSGGAASIALKGGTRLDGAISADSGSTRAGLSVLTPTGANSAAGGKVIYRENAGGAALTIAGETWKVNGGNFLGIVAGAHTHIDAKDRKGDTLTTVAPFLAVSGGTTTTITRSDKVQVDAFWNANARVNVPLVLGAEARARVDDDSNGMMPGGAIDPGQLAANTGFGTNAGVRAGFRLSDRLTLTGAVTGHATATDPTLAPIKMVPVTGSLEASAGVKYQSERASVQAGVSATAGSLYDKDTRVKGWADGQFKLSDKVDLGISLSGGRYVNGGGYADGQAGVVVKPNKDFSLSAGVGVNVQTNPGSSPVVSPNAGAALTWHW